MKKLLTLALLSLGLLALNSGQASAIFFFHRCHKCCATICCKPYNAFTPTCTGTLFCNGCCPIGFGGPGHGPGPGADWGPGCTDGGYVTHGAPAVPVAPANPAPAGGGPDFKPPTPNPLPSGSSGYHPGMMSAPIHHAAYHPGYYGYGPAGYGQGYGYAYPQSYVPSPYPYGYAPMMNYGGMGAMPAYWYGSGR